MRYIHDGSFEAILTAVFYAYKNKELDCEIVSEKENQSFFEQRIIFPEQDKAIRVLDSCRQKISQNFLHDIYYVYLSELPHSGTLIKDYIRLGLRYGRLVHQYLHLQTVYDVMQIRKKVSLEAHRLKGLVRFSKSDAIYYADITPDFNVLLLVSRHFEKRMPNEKWIICDLKRKTAALHLENETIISEMTKIIKPPSCPDETERAWCEFYNSIAIDERRNEKLRKNMMPERYWKNMTEFKAL